MAIYSDLNSINPTQKPLVEDFQSVYQALIILFNTRPGEILFDPEYGIDLEEELFELMDESSADEVYNRIFNAVERYEPRAIIDNSTSKVVAVPDENRFELTLQFGIEGLSSTQKFELIGSFSP